MPTLLDDAHGMLHDVRVGCLNDKTSREFIAHAQANALVHIAQSLAAVVDQLDDLGESVDTCMMETEKHLKTIADAILAFPS